MSSPRWIAALGLMLALAACAAPRPLRPTAELRRVAATRIAVVPPETEIKGGTVDSRSLLETRLAACIAAEISRRGRGLGGTQSPLDGARVARIQRALADSPVWLHREFVGAAPPPRGRLAADDVRAFAEGRGADAVLVARLVGTETTAAGRVADSALSFVQGAAIGVVSLSPTRVVRAAVNAPNASPGSHLRLALVDPASGEILWAEWAVIKRSPSPEVIDELVSRVFARFPA